MTFLKENFANILTVSRLFLLPIMIGLFYLEPAWGGWAAWLCGLVYAIAAVTDFFDGYVARKYNQTSAFGTFLDPISDKIFVATLMILLVGAGRIAGLWLLPVIVIFAREFLISGLREFLGPKNVQVPVMRLAKWKTASQMLAIFFLIIGPYAPYALGLGLWLLMIAAVLTVITGAEYMIAGAKHFRTPE
ncbi:MAG: CDP-diacylglycerol--glycerol-3-phosphate 3-phosphatidyltransferase [Alphaproteobacteria bacterium]|nr:CDP-diacylglycerol--glycerol-3-phosphate 3-phosphatidyltransferase [Alphaproteobacteria bacterium]